MAVHYKIIGKFAQIAPKKEIVHRNVYLSLFNLAQNVKIFKEKV